MKKVLIISIICSLLVGTGVGIAGGYYYGIENGMRRSEDTISFLKSQVANLETVKSNLEYTNQDLSQKLTEAENLIGEEKEKLQKRITTLEKDKKGLQKEKQKLSDQLKVFQTFPYKVYYPPTTIDLKNFVNYPVQLTYLAKYYQGWKKQISKKMGYKNEMRSFSFMYPPDWYVKETFRRGEYTCYDYEIIYKKKKEMKISIEHVCGGTGQRAHPVDPLISSFQYLRADDNKYVDILRLLGFSYIKNAKEYYVFNYRPSAGKGCVSYAPEVECQTVFYPGLTTPGSVRLHIPKDILDLDRVTPAERDFYLRLADKIVLSIRKM